MLKIALQLIHPAAKIPSQAHSGDAGYDLSAVKDLLLLPGQRQVVPTGLILEIPVGYYGRIAPRSGLAVKQGLDVLAGVIDASYRNEIGVVLINLGDEPIVIKTGDRIAQLIIENCQAADFQISSQLSATERQLGGFGSSGQ
jgi:dUTP pyrophosphatase